MYGGGTGKFRLGTVTIVGRLKFGGAKSYIDS